MPDRIIRERARRSPTLKLLSDAAERAWWRLTTVCDDHGRFDADPEILLNSLFPGRPHGWSQRRMASVLEEWCRERLVVLYTAMGRRYGYLVTWSRYQRPPRLASKYPDPPEQSTIPAERTIHDAVCIQLRDEKSLFGAAFAAVDRNVRIGNGFADLVLVAPDARHIVEIKRTRADQGAIRQVVGYRQHLAQAAGGLIIATGMGPTVGPQDFAAAEVALATYDTNWKVELAVPAGPFMDGTILDLRGHVNSHANPCDFTVGTVCPGDERREARDEKRETRSEKRAERGPAASATPDFQIAESIQAALSRCPFLTQHARVSSPVFWRAEIRACPRLDFPRELLKAEAWCSANPTKAPKRDIAAFLHRWFARAAEKLGDPA